MFAARASKRCREQFYDKNRSPSRDWSTKRRQKNPTRDWSTKRRERPDERLVNETTRKTRRKIGQRNDPDESTTFDHSENCGGEARTRKATQSPPTVRCLMSFVPRKNTKGSKQELSKKLDCNGRKP